MPSRSGRSVPSSGGRSTRFPRAVAVSPRLVACFGPADAILLSQILYWQLRLPVGRWVYKTEEKMLEETGLSRHAQRGAIRRLSSKGALETGRFGMFNRRQFRVDRNAVLSFCRDAISASGVWSGSAPRRGGVDVHAVEHQSSTSWPTKTESIEIESREKESGSTRRNPAELARNGRALDRLRSELSAKGVLSDETRGSHD